MLLLLARHGVTDHVGVKLSGWRSGVHLSVGGRAQADRLVERLDGVRLDAIYSSPLDRTMETARPLAKARGLRIAKGNDFGEVHYGDLEGKSLKVIAKSPLWRKLGPWPSDVRFPNGESLRETQARAVGAVEKVRAKHGHDEVAIVVSHGDWIRLVMAHYMGVHIDQYNRLVVAPASVSALRFFDTMVQVHLLNDTGALAHLTPPARPAAKGKRR